MKIHQKGFPWADRRTFFSVLLIAAAATLILPASSKAQNIIMNDGGSTATINLGGGTGNLGMNSWSVDTYSQNQLNQQWFWYSINGAVGQSVDQLGLASLQTANGADGINTVVSTYQNSQLSVNIEYMLQGNGSGSGSADITELVTIQNIGSTSYSLNFFQYSDFNLLGGANDQVSISGSPSSGFTGALQTTATGGGAGLAEVINAPNANFAEANYADGSPSSTLYKLNNTASLTLDNNQTAGPGDVTWALEWSRTLAPGDMLDITKDKGLSLSLVPEPSTLMLIALGMGALGMSLRRKLS